MNTTTAPAIETSTENGHLIHSLIVNGAPVAERYMHIATGNHYVRDFTTGPTGTVIVNGTQDERAAKVAFTRLYRAHAA